MADMLIFVFFTEIDPTHVGSVSHAVISLTNSLHVVVHVDSPHALPDMTFQNV